MKAVFINHIFALISLPTAKHKIMHVTLFFFGVHARESLHDWLSPITRQEKITWRKCPMTGSELVYSSV